MTGSSIGTSILLAQEGLEPVIQMTCRDRNRLAIQSDLMGAYIHGIRNVLCLSGDHQSFGNHPGAKNVHDIIEELKNVSTSERSGRAQDQEDTYAMQKLRARGYM